MPNLYPTYLKQLDKIESEFSNKQLDSSHELLKGFAKYSAKIQCQLDDGHQWLMQSLMQAADPDSMRAFPAMNTLQITPQQDLNEKQIIGKNTIIKCDKSAAEYQTVYPITLAPIELQQFQLDKQSSCMQFTFAATNNEEVEWQTIKQALTLYWRVPALYAERLHQLFYYECDKVEINGEINKQAVAFKVQENIRSDISSVHKARETLTEYANYPQAFSYLYFNNIEPIKTKKLNCRFYFKQLDRELASFLEKRHFALFCSPIKRGKVIPAKIISVNAANVLYRLVPDTELKAKIVEIKSVEAWLPDGRQLNAIPMQQCHFNSDNDLVWQYHGEQNGIRFIKIKESYQHQNIIVLVNLLCDIETQSDDCLTAEIKDQHLLQLKRLTHDTPVNVPNQQQEHRLTLNEIMRPNLSAIYATTATKQDLIKLFSMRHPFIAQRLDEIVVCLQCVDTVLQDKTTLITRAVLAKKLIVTIKRSDKLPLLLIQLIYHFLENAAALNQWIVMELHNDREELIQSW